MKNNQLALASALVLSLALLGCNDEDSGNNPPTTDEGAGSGKTETCGNMVPDTSTWAQQRYATIELDASCENQYVYLHMVGGVVDADKEWHLGFKATDIIINEGVEVALVEPQTDFYDGEGNANVNVIVNATADGELAHLTGAQAAAAEDYSEATNAFAINNNAMQPPAFVNYTDEPRHVLEAADERFWLIRSSDSTAFAKLRVTQVAAEGSSAQDSDAYDSAVIELSIAPDINATFASPVTWQISTPGGNGDACYDINTAAEVNCSSDDWDIHYSNSNDGLEPTIRLNGGISGPGSAVALGPYDQADTAQIATPVQDVANDAFDINLQHWDHVAKADSQSSVFSENRWYYYDRATHVIWPNYRVYHIKDGELNRFIQITNYYGKGGEERHITFRYSATR